MKFATAERNIQSQGVAGEREYKIKIGAHMMMVLSDLYSDPIWAIVREYATNMLDGYTKLRALNPQAKIIPPEIQLPNMMAPHIVFKDYGVGMSFDTVWEVFTSYGDSTKHDNNDEVGGLGIGSKVAFAYRGADQWIVESRYNGERMIFNALKNAQGIPTLQHIQTLPTDEPNGVTIQIPVARQDFEAFRKATERLVQYFPMDINVSGNTAYEKPSLDYTMRGPAWGILAGSGKNHVIMGNVPYPLELHQLPQEGVVKYLQDQKYALHVDVYLPVGSADFTPSREALLYSERTKTAVANALNSFLEEMQAKAQAEIQSAPTLWEACKALYEISGKTGLRKYLSGIKWRGLDVNLGQGVKFDLATLVLDYPDLEVERYDNFGNKASIGRTALPSEGEYTQHSLTPDSKLWVFVDDTGKHNGPVRRVRNMLLNQLTGEHGWSQRKRRIYRSTGAGYVFKATGLTPDKLKAILFGFPVENVTTLPEPVYARNGGGTRKKVSVKYLNYSSRSLSWEDADVEVEDGGYYVPLEGGSPMDTNDWALSSMIKSGKLFGILPSDFKLYGIPRSRANIEKKPGWVNFLTWFTPKAKAEIEKLAKDYREVEKWEDALDNTLVEFASNAVVMEEIRRVRPRSPMIKLGEAAQQIEEKQRKVRDLDDLARVMNTEIPKRKITSDPEAMIALVKEKHPNIALMAELASGNYQPVEVLKNHLPTLVKLL